jgi:two-component system, cell cycle sensor histidine kinase and response regulator CckA
VQVASVDILWVLVVGSVVLGAFAIAYIVMTAYSHRRIVETQKAKLAEVKASEEKFRSLFDNSLAGMMRFSVDPWELTEANDAMFSLSGCTSLEELRHCAQLLPAGTVKHIQETMDRSGFIEEYEIRATRRSGEPLWFLFSARKLTDQPYVQAVVIDITKRKQFEEQIREQSALLDQTQDAIVVIDYDGKIVFWNAGAELMYGWLRDEAAGWSIGDLLFTDPQRVQYREVMEDIRRFREWNGELHQVRKDLKEILVESRWRSIEKTTSGTMQVLIVSSDITEKKRLESHYIQAQKMESIALLTGGMAHDLQNVLAPVAMSVPLLRSKITDASGLEVLKAVEESANSGLELVKNILTYGRGIVGERVDVNVSHVVDQVLSVFTPGLPSSIRIERKMNGRTPPVTGDPQQLKQVILNLCVNARDAMAAGGVLSISVENLESDEKLLDEYPYAEPGPYVVAAVSDTGMGIGEEDLERIFEPFYTTKEHGYGTGLGLSIAQGIVKSHQGYILVNSVVGSGTTFRVYLPVAAEAAN